MYVCFKYDLGQKYYALKVQLERALNSWPPDDDSRPTFHVTETPALTTWPPVTNKCNVPFLDTEKRM